MHQVVKLNLPHAPDGKLYLEGPGRRVLHVFPDLSSENEEALGYLRRGLDKLVGGLNGYDDYVIHPKMPSHA